MTIDDDLERVLAHLSPEQVLALAKGSAFAPPPGASPAGAEAVLRLSASVAADPALSVAGAALALRTGLRAQRAAAATRSRPVWTGPHAKGEQRLTAGVLHGLIVGARERVLLTSYATATLPSVASDLEAAVEKGCQVDVVFETTVDSSGQYKGYDDRPFSAVAGIKRWRWPADQREAHALLHAKLLVVDGRRALIGSANLTRPALTKHLEAGLLVRDPVVARALEDHVRALMEGGVLVAV